MGPRSGWNSSNKSSEFFLFSVRISPNSNRTHTRSALGELRQLQVTGLGWCYQTTCHDLLFYELVTRVSHHPVRVSGVEWKMFSAITLPVNTPIRLKKDDTNA